MEHRFCLDEILGKVSEMINDGYHLLLVWTMTIGLLSGSVKAALLMLLIFRLILTDFFLSFCRPGRRAAFFYSLARGSGSGSARGYPRAMLAVLSPVMI